MRALLLSLPLALLAAAPAAAGTVSATDTTITFSAASGERNRVTVRADGPGVVRVSDAGALTAASGCVSVDARTVRCTAPAATEVVADLADRSDRLSAPTLALRLRARGGTGDDSVRGGPGADELDGGDGNDRVAGGPGPDAVRGGAGRDTLLEDGAGAGSTGPDLLDGGAGSDTVSYFVRGDALRVTLGGGADDGAPGEGDDVRDVGRVVGGRNDDELVGGPGGDRLEGGPGRDRVSGEAGGDSLDGGAGDDLLAGGPNGDALYGGSGDDAQDGGPGSDTFFAGTDAGADAFTGGEGFDRADYARRTGGVTADADGRADDGARAGELRATGPVPALELLRSGERDNVLPDVEHLRGGRGDDLLGATSLAAARLDGGPGTDVLFGGAAPDRLFGESGFDRLIARDPTRDQLSCGSEGDRVFVTTIDAVGPDCEARSTSFAVALAPAARRLDGAGRLLVRVACPAQAFRRCVGAVRAASVRRFAGGRTLALGAAPFNAQPGTTTEVAIAVSGEGRAQLDRLGALRVRLSARGRDEAGPARSTAARFVLRR